METKKENEVNISVVPIFIFKIKLNIVNQYEFNSNS